MKLNELPEFEIKQIYDSGTYKKERLYSVHLNFIALKMDVKGVKLKVNKTKGCFIVWPCFLGLDPVRKKWVKVPVVSFEPEMDKAFKLALMAKAQAWLNANKPIKVKEVRDLNFHVVKKPVEKKKKEEA